jgi:hypothetical protein
VVEAIAHRDPKRRRSSMFSIHHTLKRLSRGIAVAAVLAALVAPAALATRSSSNGDQDGWYKFAMSGGAGKANAGSGQGYRFVTDTLAPGGGVVAVSPGVQGFDWTDAGIGAGGTVGLVLILLGGTRLMSHRRDALAV